MGLVLIIVVLLLLFGGLPSWGYPFIRLLSKRWTRDNPIDSVAAVPFRSVMKLIHRPTEVEAEPPCPAHPGHYEVTFQGRTWLVESQHMPELYERPEVYGKDRMK